MKNAYEVRGEVTAIILRCRDGSTLETIIDTRDFDKANSLSGTWKPYIKENLRTLYVFSDIKLNGKTKKVFLHRWINDVTDLLVIDHINHDGLDNRKENTRIVNSLQNGQNKRGSNLNSTSKIRGVHWHTRSKRWRVKICVNRKDMYIGQFVDIKEAEQAAIEARKKYMPYSNEAS